MTNSSTADRGRSPLWSTGRYPSLAPNMLPAHASLVDAAGIDPGDAVLDVGCGTGNVALTARQSGARVVGVDLSREMLDLAADSAALVGDDEVEWVAGDAVALPVRDDEFDAVLSSFGHVFAPESTVAGRELRRVIVPGGRVAFTAWSPVGVVGELTEVLTRHVDEPPGDPWAHLEWGRPAFVREQFPAAADLSFERRILEFRYVSPEHFWLDFAEEAGPLSPVLGRVTDPAARERLRDAALETLEEWFADNAVRVEYLQVRAVVA
ncbi:class I SAM-dependent methyltransferase [Halovivax sp.]|uniref:class I SAM-dependent methyltransferase n=1 Tax=Halovivax sp. TaxID=1935978 RepID=UPI0025C6CBAB|nr:methyltransferase domain-containing protein [Halovivax sp.]